jgi:phosphonate transport system substrate-binding protein
MISRRHLTGLALFSALSVSALALAACGKPNPSGETREPNEVRFSILSTESATSMGGYWKPILADMEKQTGLKVKPYFSSNYTTLVTAMQFKQTEVGWFSNLPGLDAVRRANGEVFARTYDPSGTDGYKSVIIVGAKSGITLDRVLKCDKSLTFGIGDVRSTSGTLAPLTYLFAPKGIKPETCFKTVRSGSHQSNLFSVANGQLDVATNNSTALLLNAQRHQPESTEVKVIWESPTLPEDPIIYRRDLDPAIKEKLRQFFLTYGQGNTPEAAQQRANMAKINIGGFKPADESHLLPVREMEATQNWLLAKETGDQAKVDAAKKALDAITAQRVALEARTRTPAAAQ